MNSLPFRYRNYLYWNFDEEQIRVARAEDRWAASVQQHQSHALTFDQFRAKIQSGSSYQYVILPVDRDMFDLAMAGKTAEGEVVFGWERALVKTRVSHYRLFDPSIDIRKLQVSFLTVYEVEGETVREVELADSWFGPMLPPEPTRTYRMNMPWILRVIFKVYGGGCFLCTLLWAAIQIDWYIGKVSGPLVNIESLWFWIPLGLAVSAVCLIQVRQHGKTYEICDSELPRMSFERDRYGRVEHHAIKHRIGLSHFWLERVEESP